ncbi:MAG: group II truncated hemoglobin [Rubripirellula sp.]
MLDVTIYERLGGEQGVRAMVDRFYDLMSELPEARKIRELHPEDLSDSRDKLFKFLSGFYGGPGLYVQEFGHPMLRARHLPFPIGITERDQWLLCMNQAVDELVEDQGLATHLKMTFFRTADHMRNSADNAGDSADS